MLVMRPYGTFYWSTSNLVLNIFGTTTQFSVFGAWNVLGLQYAGSAWDELKHIRQAVGFLVCSSHLKLKCYYHYSNSSFPSEIVAVFLPLFFFSLRNESCIVCRSFPQCKHCIISSFYPALVPQVIHQKYRISYDEITNDLCPVSLIPSLSPHMKTRRY